MPSLVIPICLGLTMYVGLSYLIDAEFITNEKVLRYLTGHPVSKVTVAMFFIGLASLLMIANDVFGQFRNQKKISLDTQDEELQEFENFGAKEQAVVLAGRLETLPKSLRVHYLWQRLQSVLHSIYRTSSVSGVEDELKYLAELDLDQQQQRYSLARILIWATPMLGFLGTVLGISQALGGINVGGDNNFQTMMDGLRGSLYVAFDTTALALTLSMFLMFCQFLVDRFESQLLLLVDQKAQTEINRHVTLLQSDSAKAKAADSLDAMTDRITEATVETSKKQTEVWRKTIQAAQNAWSSTLTDANMQVQSNMSDAIDENVASLAHYLGEAIEKADLAMSHRWQQWQVTLSENARLLERHHTQLAEQTLLLQDLMANSSQQNVAPTEVTNSESTPSSDRLIKIVGSLPADESNEHNLSVETSHQLVDSAESVLQDEPVSSVDRVIPDSSVTEKTAEVVLPAADQSARKAEPNGTISFQDFLETTLAKSTRANQTKKVRSTESEVILPFPQVLDSNSRSGSGRQYEVNFGQSKKAA